MAKTYINPDLPNMRPKVLSYAITFFIIDIG